MINAAWDSLTACKARRLEDTMSDALCVLDAAASGGRTPMGTSEGSAASALLASYLNACMGSIPYSSTPKLVLGGGSQPHADQIQTENENRCGRFFH
ncbi:MAG: hypothetical protein U0X92_13270 [Anaerolineales bacterium]